MSLEINVDKSKVLVGNKDQRKDKEVKVSDGGWELEEWGNLNISD